MEDPFEREMVHLQKALFPEKTGQTRLLRHYIRDRLSASQSETAVMETEAYLLGFNLFTSASNVMHF